MGKRELLLIVCFVIVGAVVYQATAPPRGPNDRGFSFSRLIEAARREVRGNRASAETTTSSTQTIGAEITEVRIVGGLSNVEITGEDRADVATSLRVVSNAYDDAEAKKYADETRLKTDRAAASLAYSVVFPQGRHSGRQRVFLTLKVPSRLRIRVESRPGKISIVNVAAVEASNLGGEATIKKISGHVAVTHRGGRITIEDVAALKFNGRGIECIIKGIRDDASMVMEGGECTASQIGGSLEVEARNAEVNLEGFHATRGSVRVNAVGGSIRLRGVKSDTRVDGRNSEIDITMTGAAPLAVYNEGEDVSITPPPGGYRFDAVVVDGRIAPESTLQELGLKHETAQSANESRASGTVRGGGATITIRATRGDLTLRTPEKPENATTRQ
jgi:hypothetical protein